MVEDRKIRVSIIIPMYCAQEYVDSILDCFVNQTVKEIEILCVVDGSTDYTLERVKEYAKKDARIQVFWQEHKGAGAARNLGLSHAKGNYVLFPDADDEYKENYISGLLEMAEASGADIAMCYASLEDKQTQEQVKTFGHKGYFYPKNKAIPTQSISRLLTITNNAAHNKILRMDLIKENQLSFSETMSINDMFFTMCALVCSKNIVFMDDCLYTIKRNRNHQSISTNRGNHWLDLITTFQELYAWLEERDCFEKYKKDYFLKFSRSFKEYATTTVRDEFAQSVAYYLATQKPWVDMDANSLQRNASLFLSKTKDRIKKENKEVFKTQLENIYENIDKVQRILKDEYGIDLTKNDNRVSEFLARIYLLEKEGISEKLYEKIERKRLR